MNKILTIEEIKKQLRDRSLAKVAAAVGIHENTIYSFMRSDNPSYRTAEKLSKYLEEQK